MTDALSLSPRRRQLDSLEYAHAVAARLRISGIKPVYVVRSSQALQPIRVTTGEPRPDDEVILVLL